MYHGLPEPPDRQIITPHRFIMHIGKLIRQKIVERGITVVSFAEQLSCTRINAYKIFERSSIDTDLLVRISKILDYNFFVLYSSEFKADVCENESTTSDV